MPPALLTSEASAEQAAPIMGALMMTGAVVHGNHSFNLEGVMLGIVNRVDDGFNEL
jgi:hypothetical protein